MLILEATSKGLRSIKRLFFTPSSGAGRTTDLSFVNTGPQALPTGQKRRVGGQKRRVGSEKKVAGQKKGFGGQKKRNPRFLCR